MMSSPKMPTEEQPDTLRPPVRDVADFHLRWPEFRQHAIRASKLDSLTNEEHETLVWLIAMADRIGEKDLK
jgi:hypothetical protein